MAKTILFYGAPGTSKTPLSMALAVAKLKVYRQQTGIVDAKIRLITAEVWDTVEGAVDAGLVDVWEIDKWEEPFEALTAGARGAFPEDPNNPKSKYIEPTAETFAKYPIAIHEGLSTYGAYCLGSYASGGLAARVAKGEKVGGAKDVPVFFKDGEVNVGAVTWTHFGTVQKWIHNVVKTSGRSGYLWSIYTAHESSALDNIRGWVIGPEIVGEAATPEIPRWFGMTFHTYKTVDRTKNPPKQILEVFLKDHYDSSQRITVMGKGADGKLERQERMGVPFIANPRVIPELFDKVPEKVPATAAELMKAVDLISKLHEEAKTFYLK